MSENPELPLHLVRARSRPGMVLAAYLIRLILASLLALPLANRAADFASGRSSGDLVFFEPGGLYLLEALRLGRHALPSDFARIAGVVLLAGYLGLFPLAALIWSLSRRGKIRTPDLVEAALRPLGTLSLLLGLALATYAVLATLAFALLTGLISAFDERTGFFVGLGALSLALLLASAVGVIHDLARAHAVVRSARALESLRVGFLAFGARPWLSWASRMVASLALFSGAAWAVGQIGVESGGAVLAVALVHQLTAFGLVALRASWLAAAIRALRAPLDRPARSVAPACPSPDPTA